MLGVRWRARSKTGWRWFGAATMGAVVFIGASAGALGQGAKPDASALPSLDEGRRLNRQVFKLNAAGKYDEAIPLAERVRGIQEKALGPDHPDVATALNNLAALYQTKGDYTRAEPLLQRALAIREKALGPDHPDVANSLNDLAVLYQTKGDYPRAEPLFQRALAIREKALGPEHPQVAQSLNNLAALYNKKGDYAGAEPLYQRALAIREKALGPDHPEVAVSLNNLAQLYRTSGDYTHAEPLYERALAIEEKALGPDHSSLASTLNNLAALYDTKGDYARAEPLFQRALGIYEKALGPDHISVATLLNNLGELYRTKGDYTRAEPFYLRALAITEKALGPDHPTVATSLNNLAGLYAAKGDYARAEPLYQRALGIKEKTLGPEHSAVATSLNNIALLYQMKGDYARAEPLYQRALDIKEKALGLEHPAVATSLNNLAALYEMKGDQTRAEALYRRALGIYEKALGPEHPDVASSLHGLAMLYDAKGDYARAEPLCLRALGILEKALGPAHPKVALSLLKLAAIYDANGKYARAEPLYLRALDIQNAALGLDHPHVAFTWSDMALSFAAQGRLVKAVNAAQWATNIQDQNATALVATGSEEQKRLYMNTLVRQTHNDISLHCQHAPTNVNAARLAFTALLRRKGRVLETMTDSLAALRQSLAPADQELADQLAPVYSQLATQLARGPGTILPEQYRKNITALENERQKLESDIGRQCASFRVEKRSVNIEDIQAAIPKNAALLEIAHYEPIQFPSPSEPNPKSKPRYAAYVLQTKGTPAFVDLGEAAPLEDAIKTLRLALADPDLTHDPKPAARALDQLLMEPIRKLLGDTRWVFVSADGPTHLVPFAALVDEDDHYLVERYLFSYINTGRDLLRFAEKPIVSRETPLVLANPAFDDSSAPAAPEATHRGKRSIDMVTQRLLPLGGTVEEAKTIHRLFPDSRVLLGVDATEEAIKAVHAPRILHLATHGFFLPEQPVPDVLLRTTCNEPTAAERAAVLQRENPLLRSGIALAGFNQRQSGIDDGVLTALEVAGLDLYGTRLVVLSACETGVGQASSGEGVYGLRRALSMAGAETQVMSLWQVDTGRTRELMQSYYLRLQGASGRSESMRYVQLAMLSIPETSHPNLWASFIVSGDWRALQGDAVKPDLTVHPGPRGCACAYPGETSTPNAGWLVVALGLAAMLRVRIGRPFLQQLKNGTDK